MITVFQAKNFRDACMIDDDVQAAKELFINGGYEKVADVNTDDLDIAYEKSNSIACGWWENDEIVNLDKTVEERGGCRSTSAGDILLDENNNYWLVAMCGFEKLPRIDLDELKF